MAISKHEFLASAVFLSILSGMVKAPIAPMSLLLALPVMLNIYYQLALVKEPFFRFARAVKLNIGRARSAGPLRMGAAQKGKTVTFADQAQIMGEHTMSAVAKSRSSKIILAAPGLS